MCRFNPENRSCWNYLEIEMDKGLELHSSASHGAIDYLAGKVCFVYIGSGDL